MKKTYLILTTFTILGCGTPHISDEYLSVDYTTTKYSSANVSCDDGEENKKLENYIRTYLQKENIQLGDNLLIKCKFISYDAGNRALRYWVGFGAGSGHSDISVELFNSENQKVSSFRVKADLSVGAFGGNAENMIKDSAIKIVKRVKPLISNQVQSGFKI